MANKTSTRILVLASAVVHQMHSLVVQRSFVKIFPTGQGHYALGSPDGTILNPGDTLTILLAGRRVTGTVRASIQGDYLQLSDGSCCGLCACMRVIDLVSHLCHEEVVRW